MMKKIPKVSFTKAYQELEQIVGDFEAREIDLEKDLVRFERGLELASQLQKKLDEVENKVTEIEKKFAVAGSEIKPDEDENEG
jgi:exodeoxyribonuclease VII small subunit